MITEFEECVEIILQAEGGEVNDPDDPGGHTKFGISKRAYPDVDIGSLTVEKAKEIYRKDYWDECYADNLPADVRLIHFDTAVNAGLSRAAKILQESIGGIAVDGIIGPQTLAYSTQSDLKVYAVKRLGFYMSIIANKPVFTKYAKGWFNRVDHIVEMMRPKNHKK